MDNSKAPPTNSSIHWRWVILSAFLAFLIFLFGGISTFALVDPPPTAAHVVPDQAIAIIISQVTTRTLEYDLNGLTGERLVTVGGVPVTISSRRTLNDKTIRLATQYAYEQFTSYGLDVAYHEYTWTADNALFLDHGLLHNRGPHTSRNVVAEKPGLVDPAHIYLLTAHIDDLPMGLRAPGADDNASGSVAVLTAARLLAPHDFVYTTRFVLLTGEEQGFHGSAAYAAECAARGDDIRGVINLDMIAYNSDSESIIGLYATRDVPASLALTQDLAYAIRVYDLKLIPEHFDSSGGPSDHGSFIAHGYPAILVIEDTDDFSPYWHKITDRVSTLDLGYHADVTRAVVAAVAHLAVLIR